MKRSGPILFRATVGRIKVVLRKDSIVASLSGSRETPSTRLVSDDQTTSETPPPTARRQPQRRKGIVPPSQNADATREPKSLIPRPKRQSTNKSVDKGTATDSLEENLRVRSSIPRSKWQSTNKSVDASTDADPLKEAARADSSPPNGTKSNWTPLQTDTAANARSTTDEIEEPSRCHRGSTRGKNNEAQSSRSHVPIRPQLPSHSTTPSTSTAVSPSAHRRNGSISPVALRHNRRGPQQQLAWDRGRAELDKHHLSWLDHYAGNSETAQYEVLEKILEHKNSCGSLPMEVRIKANAKSGVEKVVCGVCRRDSQNSSLFPIREFPTVQKAATHITSEHWQLPLWSCPYGCGKCFQYRDGIQGERKHLEKCPAKPSSPTSSSSHEATSSGSEHNVPLSPVHGQPVGYNSQTYDSTFLQPGYPNVPESSFDALAASQPGGTQYNYTAYADPRHYHPESYSQLPPAHGHHAYFHQQPPVILSGSGPSMPRSGTSQLPHRRANSQAGQPYSTPQYTAISVSMMPTGPNTLLAQPWLTPVHNLGNQTPTQSIGTPVYNQMFVGSGPGPSPGPSPHQQHLPPPYGVAQGLGAVSGHLLNPGDGTPRRYSHAGRDAGASVAPASQACRTGRHSIASALSPTVQVSFLHSIQPDWPHSPFN